MQNKRMASKRHVYIVFYKKNLAYGGGAERRILRTINGLKNPGLSLTVVTNRACETVVSRLLDNRTIKKKFLPDSNVLFSWFFFIRYFISKKMRCTIHLITANRALFPFVIYSLFFHDVIISVTSYMYSKKKFGKSMLTRVLIELLVRHSKRIDWLYSYYSEKWTNCYAKSTVTPCSSTDYAEFGLDGTKENILLFSGQLIKEKQPILALNAIMRNKDIIKRESYRVVFLGDGYLRKELERRVVDSNMGSYVQILTVNNTADIVKRTKIFLSVQGEENYPSQSFLEAISAGCIVVATDVGDTWKLGYKTVILVENCLSALTEGIRIAIERYELLSHYAFESRQELQNEHSLQRSADYYARFYEGKQ